MAASGTRRIACALLLAGVACSGAATAASPRPSLDLMRMRPLMIRGEHFKPGERVGIHVSGAIKASRTAIANGQGLFVVRFRARVERCEQVTVHAFGSRGSRARTLPRPRPDFCLPSR